MKVTCHRCGKVGEAWKFFDRGPCCETCVRRASAIVAVYVIDGIDYVERLKQPMRIVETKRVKTERAPAVAAAGAQKGN